MKIVDFIDSIEEVSIDDIVLEELYDIYGKDIPEIVLKIVIKCKEENFFDGGGRLLSFYEVCHSDDEYDTRFVESQMIPLIDLGDNDFIVYDLDSNLWKKYNIVDELDFEEASELKELL